MPNAVVVAGIAVAAAVGFAAVTAVAEASFGVVVDCVTLAADLAGCDFLAVLLSVVVSLAVAAAVEALAVLVVAVLVVAVLVVAVLVVVVVLVTALVAGAVLAVVVSETVLVAANA